jgi:hypothetical protein
VDAVHPDRQRATDETLDIANLGWSAPGEKRLLYTRTGNRVTIDRSAPNSTAVPPSLFSGAP